MSLEHAALPVRRLSLLFLCQAFYWITVIVGVAFSGLVGLQLASHQAFATVPMATLTIGNILATFPLSLLMQRYGRRWGFMVGALAMILGGMVSVYAIQSHNFFMFCGANILLGVAQASAFYYRLAAADNVAIAQRGRALAWVLSGGVVAALLAPTIGLSSKDIFLPYEYVGSFYVVSLLGVFTAIAILFLPEDALREDVLPEHESVEVDTISASARPLITIVRQPAFIVALTNAALGHGVMILIMVVTPLAILACGLSVVESTSVIQWHVLGMFLPAFFSGRLIDRLGVKSVAILGVVLLTTSAVISILDAKLIHFYSALFLLGVGWNFLYLSGSTLITTCHSSSERGKVQGFAELIIAVVAACAAFGSGVLLTLWGWVAINTVVIVFLLIVLLVNLTQQALSPQK